VQVAVALEDLVLVLLALMEPSLLEEVVVAEVQHHQVELAVMVVLES